MGQENIEPEHKINTPAVKSSRRFFTTVYRVIRGALRTFTLAKGPQAASSISYFTLFSIFPLLLSVVGIGSFFMDQATVEQELMNFLPNVIPISQDLIVSNIEHVFDLRGPVSTIALIGLLWSATAVFTTIIRNINAAWPAAAPHSFIRMRLWSLAIIAVIVLVLILSSFSLTIRHLFYNLGAERSFSILSLFMSSFLYTKVLPVISEVFLFFALYYWVPQIKVNKLSALSGAVVVTFFWQVFTFFFVAFLSSGLAKYELIYGSLGSVIALMFWVYLSSWIVLFGAHLTSSIDRHT